MEISAFWLNVEQELAKYDLLQHPFYQAWSAGELSAQDLRFYAGQYFQQVSAFPAYLTALHARLPEGPTRRDVRWSSRIPSASSSCATRRLTVLVGTPVRRAASTKLRW